ncbi:hypothetical protein [Streptomyces luteogriseus]|uniref:hypothetical protein n=1 Tax=Streptomyces luteogriseus TaxID=68233 RepID=UPI0037A3B1A4
MTEENAELRAAVLDVVKGVTGYDQEEAAVDRIMQLIEEKHHCGSCDMHACGDLDRGAVVVPLKGMSFGGFKAAGRASHLNRYGQAITSEQWGKLAADPSYVRIGKTELRAGEEAVTVVRVSTMWVGINTGSGEIFESVVFRNGDQVDHQRYRTEDEAKEGHNALTGDYIYNSTLPGPKAVREVPLEED